VITLRWKTGPLPVPRRLPTGRKIREKIPREKKVSEDNVILVFL
jgi:hypothetical protein